MKTLLVGVDAACAPVLRPLLDDDALPAFADILDAGAAGTLESQIPPWTPSAWPSLYTGMNPGKHGVFDFLRFDGYGWEVTNATHLRERPLWDVLDMYGFTSVVVNVPMTHPSGPIDGALVPGYMAPEDPPCYPEGVLDEIREAIGGYRVYPDAATADDPAAAYRDVVRMRGRAFRYLVDRIDPDFGFVEFQVTDTVFHERPGDQRTVRAIYEAVDDEIGATLDACDPENVVIASDHGMGPYGGYEFRVNEFLREHGYVRAVRGGGGMPSWATVREAQLKRGDSDARPRTGTVERAMGALAKAGITSQRIGRLLEAAGLDDVVLRHVPQRIVRAGTEQVDFARSTAYMRSRTECGVRINLEGRDPEGTVPPDEYESVRAALIELLAAARTPDGEPVFEAVVPREAYFEGPATEESVDVVTVPADFDQFLSAQLADTVFDEPSEPWNHKRDGLVAAAGAAVDADASLDGAHLFDVAPTVLATFGVPADVRMDGTVLPIVEAAGERRYPSYQPRTTRSTDDEAIADRLANLGYLER